MYFRFQFDVLLWPFLKLLLPCVLRRQAIVYGRPWQRSPDNSHNNNKKHQRNYSKDNRKIFQSGKRNALFPTATAKNTFQTHGPHVTHTKDKEKESMQFPFLFSFLTMFARFDPREGKKDSVQGTRTNAINKLTFNSFANGCLRSAVSPGIEK